MAAYDGLRLAALALKATGGLQTMDGFLAALRDAAAGYPGCTGPIAFNEADDRASGSYEVWSYRDSGWAEGKLGPDVRVNASDGPESVPAGQPIEVTASLCPPGNRRGLDSDWWAAALAPDGWYYLGPDFAWHPGNDWTRWAPVWQGALAAIPPTPALRSADLPPGAYTVYFGVDTRNGRLDEDIWFDAVRFEVR